MTIPINSPDAALIVIGNEILSGRTADVHTQYLALKLKEIGITLAVVHIIPDTFSAIANSLNTLRKYHDYIFTTGGIGPTHDDITIDAIADALSLPVEIHTDAFQLLQQYYASQNVPFTDARKRMTRSPKGAAIIHNPVSCAPGFHIHNVFILAGVPAIAHAMIDNVLPLLKKGTPILAKTLKVDLPESALMSSMEQAQTLYNVSIGSYPSYHRKLHGVAIVVRSDNPQQLSSAVDFIIQHIQSLHAAYSLLDDEH